MVHLLKLQAVILTGARDSHNPLLEGTGLDSKVLLPIGGKPMVLHVLENVAASESKPTIYMSSNDPSVLALETETPFQAIPSEQNAVKSLLKSLERVPSEGWVLFVSGDHPLLTPDMINYFVDEVLRRGLTFGVAVVNRDTVNQYYPQSQRTYFPVKGGAYSGGNMFLVNKGAFQGSVAFMETIDRNRKKPWKSAFLLNPWEILQLALRQYDIHEVARRASRLFRCEAGVVDMPFAECCMDVDKPSDRELAEIILAERQQAKQKTQLAPGIDNASFA